MPPAPNTPVLHPVPSPLLHNSSSNPITLASPAPPPSTNPSPTPRSFPLHIPLPTPLLSTYLSPTLPSPPPPTPIPPPPPTPPLSLRGLSLFPSPTSWLCPEQHTPGRAQARPRKERPGPGLGTHVTLCRPLGRGGVGALLCSSWPQPPLPPSRDEHIGSRACRLLPAHRSQRWAPQDTCVPCGHHGPSAAHRVTSFSQDSRV